MNIAPMDTINKIKLKLDELDQQKKSTLEIIRNDFPIIIKPILEKYNLKSISFTGFTPYFNDGNSCTYSANTSYPTVIKYNDEEITDEYYAKGNDKIMYREIVDTLQLIPDNFYEELFGNHVEIIINRDGSISTSEYEHD